MTRTPTRPFSSRLTLPRVRHSVRGLVARPFWADTRRDLRLPVVLRRDNGSHCRLST